MNLYNKNFKWYLAGNFNNDNGLTYECKPFLGIGYNSSIDENDTPDFNDFDFENSAFIPLDKIKIVKGIDESESTFDILQYGRKYNYISSNSSFDSFDDIISSVSKNTDNLDYYYLYLNKILSIDQYNKVTSERYFNQLAIFLIYTYNGSPYKYSDFGTNDEDCQKLSNLFEVLPLSLSYIESVDTLENTGKYFNFNLVI